MRDRLGTPTSCTTLGGWSEGRGGKPTGLGNERERVNRESDRAMWMKPNVEKVMVNAASSYAPQNDCGSSPFWLQPFPPTRPQWVLGEGQGVSDEEWNTQPTSQCYDSDGYLCLTLHSKRGISIT